MSLASTCSSSNRSSAQHIVSLHELTYISDFNQLALFERLPQTLVGNSGSMECEDEDATGLLPTCSVCLRAFNTTNHVPIDIGGCLYEST